MTLIVQSHFDTLLRYVLSVTFCGAVVMKVMDQKTLVKVSVKENEVPTEKNSSRASIFATKASYISN